MTFNILEIKTKVTFVLINRLTRIVKVSVFFILIYLTLINKNINNNKLCLDIPYIIYFEQNYLCYSLIFYLKPHHFVLIIVKFR